MHPAGRGGHSCPHESSSASRGGKKFPGPGERCSWGLEGIGPLQSLTLFPGPEAYPLKKPPPKRTPCESLKRGVPPGKKPHPCWARAGFLPQEKFPAPYPDTMTSSRKTRWSTSSRCWTKSPASPP
uniref:Uncharacterized protein n=1 Tax=Thermus thermophilus (strain ATCC 27634 / DSM 579 / HB8) TaxID=300852 RepID=G9MB95_THET8|nr:Hypothetical protein [Thermus thermophilus HB8]